MNINIVTNSATELVISQQKKLTITGSLFCGPATMLLFVLPVAPGMMLLTSCIMLWMVGLICFYKGVTYTFRADKSSAMMELTVKGIFASRKDIFSYQEIHHIIMAESGRILKKDNDYNYHVIIETSENRRLKLFGFKDRNICKQTIALMESYLYSGTNTSSPAIAA